MEATSLDDSSIAKVSIMKTKKKSLFAWFGRTVAVGLVPLMMVGCATSSDSDNDKDTVTNTDLTYSTEPVANESIVGSSVIKVTFSKAVTGFTVDSDSSDSNYGSVYLTKDDGTYVPMTFTQSGTSYILDPTGDLVTGDYNLVIGFGGTIVDGDGDTADQTTTKIRVDDALVSMKAKMTSDLSGTTDAAAIVTGATTEASKVDNNLSAVIPAALKGSLNAIALSSNIAAGDKTTAKTTVVASLLSLVKGIESLDQEGRSIKKVKDTSGLTTLLNAMATELVSQAANNNVDAAEMGSLVSAVINNLIATGAEPEQVTTFSAAFRSAVDDAIVASSLADKSSFQAVVATSTGSTTTGGSTFTLTTNIDSGSSFAGGSGPDAYAATLSNSIMTLNSFDSIDGGAGTDTLTAQITSSVTPASLANIEEFTLITSSSNSEVNLTNAAQATKVVSQGAATQLTVSGISKSVNFQIRDTAQTHTVTYNDVTGSADEATITAANVSGGTHVIAGVETLNIVTEGFDNTFTGLTTAATTTLNVSGTKALTVTNNLGSTITTVNASNLTGAIDVDFGAGAPTVTGGSGNDSFNFEAAGSVSASGGAGDDTFVFDATGTFTTADTVTGGDGTDTLSATSANLVTASASTPTTYTVTGVEYITASTGVAGNAEITLANISTSATRLNLTLANGGTATFNFAAGNSELRSAVATVGAQTIDAAGSATNDNITLSATAAVDFLGNQGLTSTDFENITINTSTATTTAQTVGAIGHTASTGGTPNLIFTGSNQITTGVITNTGGSINASGLTGTTGLIMVTGQNTASSITGSAGADTLFGAITTAVSQTIDGGAGNDAITAGSGNDVITAGAGDDTVTGSGGNDSIDLGAGDDRMVINNATAWNGNDTLVGGDGTDTLAVTAVLTNNTAAELTGISGMEVFELASAGTETIDMASFLNNPTFTRVDFGDGGGGTLTVNNAPTSITDIRLLAGVAGDTAVFDRLIDGSANSLTISSRGDLSGAVTALTVNDEETLAISGSSAANDLTVTTLNCTDLTTLTITGAADIRVANALSGTAVTTVNASGSTGVVEVHATNNVAALTMTAGSGNAEFTGGLLADTITGGAGDDIIIGGQGADVISTGGGNDNVTGSAGADTVTFGSGTKRFILAADADSAVTSLATGNSSATVSITSADVLTGFSTGDIINVNGLGYTSTGTAATNTLVTAADTSITNGIADNTHAVIRGSWIAGSTTGSGTFIQATSGADVMFLIDEDNATSGQSYGAIILSGQGGTVTGATASGTGASTIVTLN